VARRSWRGGLADWFFGVIEGGRYREELHLAGQYHGISEVSGFCSTDRKDRKSKVTFPATGP